MRKPTEERKREMEMREELERLISQDASEIKSLVSQAEKILPVRPQTGFLNYHEVKEVSDNKATDIVDAIANFYLTSKIITEIPYVREKNGVDKITVSNLLFQMKTAEHAIIKLLEEIDNGNTHPRTFEVLSSLQRSKMEIVKHLAQFMVIMEQNYKNLKEDYRIKTAESSESLEEGDVTIENAESQTQFRGTKGLMDVIRQAIPETKATAALKDNEEDGEQR